MSKPVTVNKVRDELANALQIRHALAEYDDPQLILDTIEGSTDLAEACCVVIEETIEDELLLAGLDATMKIFQARKARIERSIEMRRLVVHMAMDKAGIGPIKSPLATISIRETPRKVIITDETKLPSKYFVPVDPRLDKQALGNDLRDGIKVDGAELSNKGTTISIRIR